MDKFYQYTDSNRKRLCKFPQIDQVHKTDTIDQSPEMILSLHIIDAFEACIDGRLDEIELEFEDNAAVCVVLASDGYPLAYEKGFEIAGLEEFNKHDGYSCFHAGTKWEDGKIVTNGGRVLGVTAKGADLKEARANAYKATEWVQFANKYKRNDIGKAIDEA